MRNVIAFLVLLSSPVGALRSLPSMAPAPSRSPRMQPALVARMSLLDPAEPTAPSEAVVAAVETVMRRRPEGTRLTAADLAAESGLGIEDAKRGMKELATALAGASGLSVSASDKGDLLFSFPFDVRKELASRSNAARARDLWNTAKPALQGIGRVSFGLALFASIAIIFTAIAVLQSSSDERRDDERRDDGMTGMGGGPFGGGFGFGYGVSPLDLLFPPWPYGYYGYGWFQPPPRMSLPEAIFSFVFGDGDPNAALRAARVRAMAEVIRANGGAVVAESLAPFLEPPMGPPRATDESDANVDESWVLPAVSELGGRPEVSDDGTIVYVFDDLAVSAVASEANLVLADPALASVDALDASELAELAAQRGLPTRGGDAGSLRDALRDWAAEQLSEEQGGQTLFPAGYLEERPVPFSNAEGGQLFLAGALGLVNLGGAAYLGSLLSQIPAGVRLDGDLALIQSAFPLLLIYAVAYLAVPALRFVNVQASNALIGQRNDNRRAWRDALRRGDDRLRRRLDSAGMRRQKLRLVREEEVAYDSAKNLAEQTVEQQPALDDFDRRLKDATGNK